jgi:glycosyltransferase involved in cell wall biosynthesis
MLPTDREGFPVSVLEAMRAGLPVVASRVGGIPEAVVEGETGQLAERRDPDALAAALRPLVADADRRRRYGQAGRERFLEQFSFETHLRRIWSVYMEVIDSGTKTRESRSR